MSLEDVSNLAVGSAAIILAAGVSRRLGRPKQTVKLGGETLIRRAVRLAIAAKLSPVIVVVRDGSPFTADLQEFGCLVVVNEVAKEGMASSIRCGVHVATVHEVAGVVVMACDQVALGVDHLLALTSHPTRVTGSQYAGKVGIPAYFPATSFAALLLLKGDVGARAILREADAIENEDLALDVDTEADFLAAQDRFNPRVSG
jgi:molybdenum cofactor cytidylyltransferase